MHQCSVLLISAIVEQLLNVFNMFMLQSIDKAVIRWDINDTLHWCKIFLLLFVSNLSSAAWRLICLKKGWTI